MIWWYIAVFVVALAIGMSAVPKTQTQKPAGLSEINIPTAEVGREIGVLFGTRDLKGVNVVWDGDFKTTPVMKKGGKK